MVCTAICCSEEVLADTQFSNAVTAGSFTKENVCMDRLSRGTLVPNRMLMNAKVANDKEELKGILKLHSRAMLLWKRLSGDYSLTVWN